MIARPARYVHESNFDREDTGATVLRGDLYFTTDGWRSRVWPYGESDARGGSAAAGLSRGGESARGGGLRHHCFILDERSGDCGVEDPRRAPARAGSG